MDVSAEYVRLLKLSLLDLLGPTTTRVVRRRSRRFVAEEVPEAERDLRLEGRDWPAQGMSMIGMKRLDNVQQCVETVIADGVPGDLIEAGVWRGGSTILMRALLEVRGDEDRRVWVADSFEGLPPPDTTSYPADKGDKHHTHKFLVVSIDEVRRNFVRYGLLDERVQFLPGWFRDTLPPLVDETWSVVRVDGDMYESTIQTLDALYPRLSPGGFLIVDDYGAIEGSARAVDDFRETHGIEEEIQQIDWTGVYWRKQG